MPSARARRCHPTGITAETAAPLVASVSVALELEGPSLHQRGHRLLALTATGAVDHDVTRAALVHARELRADQWQHGRLCLLPPCCNPTAFGHRPNSPPPRGFENAPERIRTFDLRLRRPTLAVVIWLKSPRSRQKIRIAVRLSGERSGGEDVLDAHGNSRRSGLTRSLVRGEQARVRRPRGRLSVVRSESPRRAAGDACLRPESGRRECRARDGAAALGLERAQLGLERRQALGRDVVGGVVGHRLSRGCG
jgi:hypothetical protein